MFYCDINIYIKMNIRESVQCADAAAASSFAVLTTLGLTRIPGHSDEIRKSDKSGLPGVSDGVRKMSGKSGVREYSEYALSEVRESDKFREGSPGWEPGRIRKSPEPGRVQESPSWESGHFGGTSAFTADAYASAYEDAALSQQLGATATPMALARARIAEARAASAAGLSLPLASPSYGNCFIFNY
ncbi:hypothetical protein T492DRAFT_325938 [Pavlovales sp. CCMP2436]|nr:hypothetical protein T492DRAFT_325938 [Pavlovales sp. CCMP2436]